MQLKSLYTEFRKNYQKCTLIKCRSIDLAMSDFFVLICNKRIPDRMPYIRHVSFCCWFVGNSYADTLQARGARDSNLFWESLKSRQFCRKDTKKQYHLNGSILKQKNNKLWDKHRNWRTNIYSRRLSFGSQAACRYLWNPSSRNYDKQFPPLLDQ